MNRLRIVVVTLALLLFAGAAFVRAQALVVLSGVVTDPSGAVVPGAAIEVRAGGRVVATASAGTDGRYRVDLAPNVRYQVRVRAAGFADEDVELAPAADTTRDVGLRIAGVGDMLIVTASRLPERRAMTAESIAVITADEIAASGASQLADVLQRVPGLAVESTGREGAVASVFARGGESDYNQVLVDGVRVNANGGQFDFSRIPAGEIDRVEVVRGAQSALYGSDAIGSVVQIFTRRAGPGDPPHVAGSIEGGSFHSWRGGAHLLGGARSRVDYHVGADSRATRGAFADRLPDDDRFTESTLNGAIGAVLGDRATIRTAVRYSDASGRGVGPIAYGPGDTGTAADSTELSWHADVTGRLTSRVTQTAAVAYFRSHRLSADRVADPAFNVFAVLAGRPGARFPASPRLVRLVDGPAFSALQAGTAALQAGEFLATTPFGVGDFPFTSDVELRRPQVRYQADARWGSGQVLTGGYEFERERNPLEARFDVDNHAYFAQQQVTLRDRWFLTVGGRLDDNSRYGTAFSPKVSLGGFLRPFAAGAVSSVKVFGSVGRGIKNPLFAELFGSAFTDGNPDLHQERARSLDAGVEATFDSQRWLARATYFDNSFTDQVAYRGTGFGLDGLPDFLNIDGSEAEGWEIEGALQRPLGGLTAGAAYSLIDTQVVSFVSTSEQFQPGQPLLRRPKHSGVISASYVVGRAAVHANIRVVGARHDAAFLGLATVAAPGAPVAGGRAVDITVNRGYTVVGLGGEYRLRDELSLFARVDNLTDETYEGALGYPGLPRSMVAGARFSVGGR